MPPTAEVEPVRGLSLSDFGGPDAPPDDARQGDALPEPTIQTPPAAADTAAETGLEPEQEGNEQVIPPDKKPEETKPILSDAFTGTVIEPEAEAAKKEEERLAAEKKVADEAAAKAAKPAEVQTDDRDKDLKVDFAPHTSVTNRKLITSFQHAAKSARDERDTIAAERDAMRKERDELAEKAKSVAVPKEIEDKLKAYAERIRELDISKDPELETKFDQPIEANNKRIVDVLNQNIATLKDEGFGFIRKADKDGKETMVEAPGAMDKLVKAGLNHKNLAPFCKVLENAGLVDEAEAIREGVRENMRLARDKQAEVDKWKVGHDQRIQAREQQTKQATTDRQQAIHQHARTILNRDLETLSKDMPFIMRPAGPQTGDAPAVVKAKEAALAKYVAAEAKINAELATFRIDHLPPEKQPEVAGKITANAMQAVTLKTYVIPELMRDLAARAARIKELEEENARYVNAGKISRIQGAAPSTEPRGQSTAASLEEAFVDPTR